MNRAGIARITAGWLITIVMCCPAAYGQQQGPPESQPGLHKAELEKAAFSVSGNIPTTITFSNETSEKRKIYWLSYDGQREFYKDLRPGESNKLSTFLTHPWLVTDENDKGLSIYYPDSEPRVVHLRQSKRDQVKRSRPSRTSKNWCSF